MKPMVRPPQRPGLMPFCHPCWLILIGANLTLPMAWPVPPSPQPAPPVRYELIEGSQLQDDCPICGRPTIVVPLHGSFELQLISENPLFSTYAITNIDWQAGSSGWNEYQIGGGRGTLQFGGEVALQQDWVVSLSINQGDFKTPLAHFTNASPQVERIWPMIQVDLLQTNGTFAQVFTLNLRAAPLREIWFSTRNSMTSGVLEPPDNRFSHGDVLSFAGQRFQSNAQLTGRLGLQPPPPDIGFDAVDIPPGQDIVFSSIEKVFSETLGDLSPGDALARTGQRLYPNQTLVARFSPMPPIPDVGLDALHLMPDGSVLFSIEAPLFSQKLGRHLTPGDLLHNGGEIYRSQAQLLARFTPESRAAAGPEDHGLDALFLWPSGEIWFSVERGFQDRRLGPIQEGDLLSDSGYIVLRNLDLVGAFSPLEDLADFGLDALFVLSDVLPASPAPRFTQSTIHPVPRRLHLEWDGPGRVFQVDRAVFPEGPYRPLTDLIPDREIELDLLSHPTLPLRQFYRLRQW